MKKRIFLVAATLGLMIGTTAFAQQQPRERKGKERPTAEQLAMMKTERMKGKLALSAEQCEALYNYNLEQIQAVESERAARRAAMEAARKAEFEKMQEARKAEALRMQQILTPEQFAQWEQLRQQKRPQGGQMHQPRRPHKMPKGAPCRCPHGMQRGYDRCGSLASTKNEASHKNFRGPRGKKWTPKGAAEAANGAAPRQ